MVNDVIQYYWTPTFLIIILPAALTLVIAFMTLAFKLGQLTNCINILHAKVDSLEDRIDNALDRREWNNG